MNHFRADFQDDDSPPKCQAQHMWHCKLILGKESIEPDRYHAGCVPHYSGWLENNHNGMGQPGFIHGHRIIDEKAEARVKYNQLCKRI